MDRASAWVEFLLGDHWLTRLLLLMTQKPEAVCGPSAKHGLNLYSLRCPCSAQLRDLPLDAWTDLGEGEAEFLRTDPAYRCAFDGERVDGILREDTTLQLLSHRDGQRTRHATAPGGEVSQLSVPGHQATLR